MNRYQLTNLLKENEKAFKKLQEQCLESISRPTVPNVLSNIQSILENSFEINVSIETCDKIRYYIVEKIYDKSDFNQILNFKKEIQDDVLIIMTNQKIHISHIIDFDFDDDEGLLHIYNRNVYIQCRINDIESIE